MLRSTSTASLKCNVDRDRPGTLALIGNKERLWDYNVKNFSYPVRVTNWHEGQQAEPKDYDFQKSAKKSLFRSTYNQIGYYDSDWKIPKPTTREQVENILNHPVDKPKIRYSTTNETGKSLSSTRIEQIECSPLPYDRYKMYLNSTYKTDYQIPYPQERELEPKEVTETRWEKLVEAGAFRKCKPNTQIGVQKWRDENPRCPFLHLKQEISALQQGEYKK